MNQLGFVSAVESLGERVVVAIALAAHRGLDVCLGRSLAVANRDVLRPAITMMRQLIGIRRSCVHGLFQRIEHEFGLHDTAHAPTNNHSGEHVNNESDVRLPRADWTAR